MSLRALVICATFAAMATTVHAYGSCDVETAEEAARGLTRVVNGDGTFHFALASSASTANQVGSLLTWEYDGQQDYRCVDTPLVPGVLDGDAEPEDSSSGLDSLMGAVRVDTAGRRWRVTAIDWAGYDSFETAYWSDIENSIGLDEDPIGSSPVQDMNDELDSDWTFYPDSNPAGYTRDQCSNGNVIVWGTSDLRSSSTH